MDYKDLSRLFLKVIILTLVLGLVNNASAQTSIDALQNSISSHNEKIKQLEQEIKAYERQIEITSGEAKSLQNVVKTIDVNQKKLGTEIKKTETNISKTNLTILSLTGEIDKIEKKIEDNILAIAETLNNMHESDNDSLIESLLSGKSISDVLDQYESVNQFQEQVRNQTISLNNYKTELNGKKELSEKEKDKLVSLKTELKDQNQVLAINKKEKSNLLIQTKNKETEYKKLLATRQAEKEKFEKELFDFENQLKRTIDPSSFPNAKKGIIGYPLDQIFVTQAFGKTIDAKRLYVSGTHNGVDFRAPRGTLVKAVLEGVIRGVGNTDSQVGCYSYGKWILIEHPNGLSSLYAHLDLIKVVAGQNVATGELIGYSGQTGYATGPHLHFTLYASQGVEIQKYSSSRNCKNTTIPVAPSNAYLDPMLYF